MCISVYRYCIYTQFGKEQNEENDERKAQAMNGMIAPWLNTMHIIIYT